MIKKFCDKQVKCTEDTDETWTCTAHMAEGRAFECPYSEKEIITVKYRNFSDGSWCAKQIMTKDREIIGQCQDWEPVK